MIIDLPPTINLDLTMSECVFEASHRFQLPPEVLFAILHVEGGEIGKKNYNTNGSYDMGPMQINSLWLDTFSNFVDEEQLTNDGCVNVHAGAWILKKSINNAGEFWTGVGNYHSKTPNLHNKYVAKVYNIASNIKVNR